MKDSNLPPGEPEHENPDHKIPKKATRTQLIQELLANQPQERQEGKYWFIETTGYIKCQHCGCATLKRSKEATWTDFINSPCIDEAYKGEAIGHSTHSLWQLGSKVTRKHCGLAVLTDKDNRLIITQALRKACKGAPVKKSTGLRTYFPTQLSTSTATPECDHTRSQQPSRHTEPSTTPGDLQPRALFSEVATGRAEPE